MAPGQEKQVISMDILARASMIFDFIVSMACSFKMFAQTPIQSRTEKIMVFIFQKLLSRNVILSLNIRALYALIRPELFCISAVLPKVSFSFKRTQSDRWLCHVLARSMRVVGGRSSHVKDSR